jgi:hypothetical protein
MDTFHESPQALIAHHCAELRREFPRIESCEARLGSAGDDLALRHSLALDIRLPQRQLLVCGEARHDALAAVHAAFDQARGRLADGARRERA